MSEWADGINHPSYKPKLVLKRFPLIPFSHPNLMQYHFFSFNCFNHLTRDCNSCIMSLKGSLCWELLDSSPKGSTSQHITKSRRQFFSLGKKGFQLSTKVNFQFLTYSKIRILPHKVLDIKI
ncbi:hypothetical protein M9H77_11777 [Catharanthus roseus]|uniref:Uncharacterized protein n=1 Tax=Catharanthus roseus TaxID=4058 RepID=A0ACC0BFM3_CATRO|nr:hypothetical protein M9H77_11777 [Catharanthus roseus]